MENATLVGCTVMVVDDEPDFRYLLRTTLEVATSRQVVYEAECVILA